MISRNSKALRMAAALAAALALLPSQAQQPRLDEIKATAEEAYLYGFR